MRVVDNGEKKLLDSELLTLIKNENQQAFEEIIIRYRVRLLAVAINRLENLEDAEECVQDVFINLWKIRHQLELRHSLNTYLSAAIKNRVFDLLARQYRKGFQVVELEETMAEDEPADADLLYREVMSLVEETLKSLPEKCEIIFRMSRFEGKSNAEIAASMDLSPKSVESYLTKAKKELLQKLKLGIPMVAPAILAQFLSVKK